jgi:hypothetical protein
VRCSERALRLAAAAAIAGAWLCAPGVAAARPDLRKGREAGPLRVYPDDKVASRFYYRPGEVVLATSSDGKPQLDFLQIAYSGSAVSGDRGQITYRNVLQIGVRMEGPSAMEISGARAALGPRAELQAMPIRRLDAVLVYAGAHVEEETPLNGGHFDAPAEGGAATAFWTERNFVLTPDVASAQLFWDALKQGQLVLSIGYAFFADAVPAAAPLEEFQGSSELVDSLKKQTSQGGEDASSREAAPMELLVQTGASSIHVDVQKWPDLLRRYEFSGNVPPGYALLDVRCYDFSDGLRPDLARRKLEIEAVGVAAKPVRLTTSFDRAAADVTTRSLRFPFAVRLDQPYRYRITDVTEDGVKTSGEWLQAESWSRMLDITTPPELRPAVEPTPEGEDDETL